MKKISYTTLLTCLFFSLSSCVTVELSPSISTLNSSPSGELVRNIKVSWNEYATLTIPGPISVCGGGGGGGNFTLKKKSDLFGPVHAEWENAKGEKLSKDFVFKKSDLPSDPYFLSSIILYFTQSDLEYYTSDNPNIKKIQREKSGNWVNKWFEKEGVRKCVNDPKEVKRLRDLDKKYPNISTVTGKPVNEE